MKRWFHIGILAFLLSGIFLSIPYVLIPVRAQTVIQHTDCTFSNTNSYGCNFASNVNIGDLLVVIYSYDNAPASVSFAPTDGQGNSYTQYSYSAQCCAVLMETAVYATISIAGGFKTIDCNTSGVPAQTEACTIIDATGYQITGYLAAQACVNNGNGDTGTSCVTGIPQDECPPGLATTLITLVVGGCARNTSASTNCISGWTCAGIQNPSIQQHTGFLNDQNPTTLTGTVVCFCGSSNSVPSNGVIVAFPSSSQTIFTTTTLSLTAFNAVSGGDTSWVPYLIVLLGPVAMIWVISGTVSRYSQSRLPLSGLTIFGLLFSSILGVVMGITPSGSPAFYPLAIAVFFGFIFAIYVYKSRGM